MKVTSSQSYVNDLLWKVIVLCLNRARSSCSMNDEPILRIPMSPYITWWQENFHQGGHLANSKTLSCMCNPKPLIHCLIRVTPRKAYSCVDQSSLSQYPDQQPLDPPVGVLSIGLENTMIWQSFDIPASTHLGTNVVFMLDGHVEITWGNMWKYLVFSTSDFLT